MSLDQFLRNIEREGHLEGEIHNPASILLLEQPEISSILPEDSLLYENIELSTKDGYVFTDIDLMATHEGKLSILMIKDKTGNNQESNKGRNTTQLRKAIGYLYNRYGISPDLYSVTYNQDSGIFVVKNYKC